MKVRSNLGIAVGALLACALAAGCSSSTGDEKGDGSGSGSDSSQKAAAIAVAEKYLQRPTDIALTTPVGKPIPSGLDIVYIPCGTPTCDQEADVIKKATDILGWQLTTLSNDGSPQQIQNAWEQVVRTKPDGVFYNGSPRSQIDRYIKEASANGTFITASSVTDPATDGLGWVISRPEQVGELGEIMAAWLVYDADKDDRNGPDVLYVNLPDFPILDALKEKFDESFDKFCTGCETKNLDIALAALQDGPATIVAQLKANPSINYVVLAVDSPFLGLPAALKAAGLDDVRILGEAPATPNLAMVKSGEEAATMAVAYEETLFGAMDAIARHAAGVPVVPGFDYPNWILTSENIPSTTELFPLVEDTEQHFRELWGK